MKIAITDKNAEKINAYIYEAEGHATARTITYETITRDIDRIERELNIPKKDMAGISAYVDHHAQTFPRSYKYKPMSTQYRITRTASAWVLEWVGRELCGSPSSAVELKLTEESKAAIIKARESFCI